MQDDLLARADRAIRESRITRDELLEGLVNARVAVVRTRATLRLARAEGERASSLCGRRLATVEEDRQVEARREEGAQEGRK